MTNSATRRVLTLPKGAVGAVVSADVVREYEREIDGLKLRLDQAKVQIQALTERARFDGSVKVLRQSAFVGEVKAERDAAALRQGDRRTADVGPGCLAEITLINLTAIIERFGDRASEHALASIAERLSGHLRDTDRVGRLGTASFGVLLAFAHPEKAQEKMQRLCDKVEAEACLWDDTPVPLRLNLRMATLSAD